MPYLLHPAYFPNIATMALLAQEDCIWELHDYFQKQTYRNRAYICTDQGRHMLSIPIKHVGGKQGKQFYRDVKVDNQYPWQRQHWRSLETAYRASPFFEYYEDDLYSLYHKRHTYLLDFNFSCMEAVCALLNIDFPEKNTATYEQSPAGITDMRHLVNAKRPIPLYQEPYTQVFTERQGFVENLSILDLLFNEGNQAGDYLLKLHLTFLDG